MGSFTPRMCSQSSGRSFRSPASASLTVWHQQRRDFQHLPELRQTSMLVQAFPPAHSLAEHDRDPSAAGDGVSSFAAAAAELFEYLTQISVNPQGSRGQKHISDIIESHRSDYELPSVSVSPCFFEPPHPILLE